MQGRELWRGEREKVTFLFFQEDRVSKQKVSTPEDRKAKSRDQILQKGILAQSNWKELEPQKAVT